MLGDTNTAEHIDDECVLNSDDPLSDVSEPKYFI